MTAVQLHFTLEELVRKIPTITALDLFKADVTPETLQLLRVLPQLSSLSIDCHSTRSFEEIGALTTLTTLKLHAERVFCGNDEKNYAEAMVHLCKLTNLRSLDMLKYRGMSDAGLAHLQQLKQLRCLTLTGCQKIGNLAVSNLLEALSNLQSLDLSSCSEITDAALASLRHMKYLQHLNLRCCSGITDAGIEVLPVTLLTLDLSETRGITPAGLPVLSTLRLLTSLDLSCKHLNDEALQHLSELVHLQHLKLGSYYGGNGITGSGFRYLSKLTSLISLDLRSAKQLTAEGLAHCAQFTALEELELFAAHIPRGGLVGLRGLTNLRCLNLNDCEGMTDEELASIADLTNLQKLDLYRVRSITDRGIQYLAKLIQLRKLDLQQTQLTAEGMRYLANLTDLEDLELTWCPIADSGLVHLAGMHKLRSLGLVACKKLIGTGLVHLTKLKALQKLELAGCNNLTEAAARPLQECTGLTTLSLDRCRGISNPAAIFVGIPTLEHLDIRDCGMTDSEAVACVAQLPALKTLIYSSASQYKLREEFLKANPRLILRGYSFNY